MPAYEAMQSAIIDGNADIALALTNAALAEGARAREILDTGLLPGMDEVGRRMKAGDCFIPEVLLSARTMQTCLDVLKPHQPTMLVLADKLGDLEGVNGVDITLIEIDNKVENIKITLEGDDVDFQDVAEVVQESGASIHSIDKCSTGKSLIDEVETPQDAGPSWLR